MSDLRGLLNAFNAFAIACLAQSVTRDLPERLLPEGYRIVPLGTHLLGEGAPDRSDTAVLSKTGSEETDWAGGYPIVRFSMPSQERPDGACSVSWKRAWDYPEPLDSLILDMAARLEARVSYRLSAILASAPENLYAVPGQSYATASDWITGCWEGNICAFSVTFFVSHADGIDITIRRRDVQRGAGDDRP